MTPTRPAAGAVPPSGLARADYPVPADGSERAGGAVPAAEAPVRAAAASTGPGRPQSRSVVALGGGHGLHASLSGLRRVCRNLTAVVTVADDGGSSGRLRREFGVLPPRDFPLALAALCGDHAWGTTSSRAGHHRFTR